MTMPSYIWNSTENAYRNLQEGTSTNTPVDPPEVSGPNPLTAGPKRVESLAEAITTFGLPLDASYISWDDAVAQTGGTDFWAICKKLPANTMLWLPERTDVAGNPIPYPIDGSRGFMASGVSHVTGPNYEQTIAEGAQPIVNEPGLWMELGRAQRGVVGQGPNAVLAVVNPIAGGMKALPNPKRTDSDPVEAFAHMTNGSTTGITGNPYAIISGSHPNVVWANFVLKTADFGEVAYNGLSGSSRASGDQKTSTIKNVRIDQAWRGDSGVPNGECGAITFNRGTVEIKNTHIICPAARVSSPIMWNNNTGSDVDNVVIDGNVQKGMTTFWHCSNTHTLKNFQFIGNKVALNIEDNASSFAINATQCDFKQTAGNGVHAQFNPAQGSNKLYMTDCTFSSNGIVPGKFSLQTYGVPLVQKQTDVKWNNLANPVNVPLIFHENSSNNSWATDGRYI